jgi:hypothetical protein
MTMASSRSELTVGRSVLFELQSGRGRGTLVRIEPGYAVVRTAARPALGSSLRLRVLGTAFGELALPGFVRWHDDDAIGLQFGSLRARHAFALNRLPECAEESPRLQLQRQGFELDAVDVVALANADQATMVLPATRERRRVTLWLRNARFDANLLRLDAFRIVVSGPVALAEGTRLALTMQLPQRPHRVVVPMEVIGTGAGRIVLDYATLRAREQRAAA